MRTRPHLRGAARSECCPQTRAISDILLLVYLDHGKGPPLIHSSVNVAWP
jgi:hypothetical protein